MSTLRERTQDIERDVAAPHAGAGGGALPALRRSVEDLLRSGDDAIERALSRDSLAFLRSNVQLGGE